MVLISTNGISSQKWLFPVSMSPPKGEFQLPSTSVGGSPRSAGDYDLGFF